jgi:hypothetical protein
VPAQLDAQTDPPQGARHPILRALENFGRLLSRKFAAALPCCYRARSPLDRAVDDTRRRLERALQHLASGKATAARFAGDLRNFAQALDRLERHAPGDAPKRLDDIVSPILAEWQMERALALVSTVHEAFSDLPRRIDSRNFRALLILTMTLTRITTARALAHTDQQLENAVAQIRDPSGATSSMSANRAIASAITVLNWLHSWRVEWPDPDDGTAARQRQAGATVTALESRLRNAGATDDDIVALIQALDPSSLKELCTSPPTGFIGEAVEREIPERGVRDFRRLQQEIASFAHPQNDAPPSPVTTLQTLLNRTQNHSHVFGQSFPPAVDCACPSRGDHRKTLAAAIARHSADQGHRGHREPRQPARCA